jgi:hypothetical protein
MKRCAECIRPANYVGIRFDSKGVCNFCNLFKKRWKKYIDSPDEQFAKNQAKLKKAIDREKRKGNKYQAILGVSGGKDSAYALYLMKEEYDINVLAYTMRSDFHRGEATENVEKIVEIFDTDHVWTDGASNELFAHSIKKTGRPCYPCNVSVIQPFAGLAKEYGVGILLSGFSPMTDGMDPEGTSPWFVRKFTRESNNTAICQEGDILYRGSYSYMVRTLSGNLKLYALGMFFPWDDDAIRALFQSKYQIDFKGEHSDCGLHEIAGLCAVRRYGFTLNMSKYCKYILLGKMTREEALGRIEEENNMLLNPDGWVKESIEDALEKLNLTNEELEDSFGVDDSRFRRGFLNWLVDYYRTNYYA